MNYYPVFLRVAGRPCVVIGGGKVAEHKVDSLRRARAAGAVTSPTVTPRLAARQWIFSALANSSLLDYLRLRQAQAADRLLAETAGDRMSLATHGMELN
jgi:siroheme synthase (precorrin-2 oxidase/ferrochelatase)